MFEYFFVAHLAHIIYYVDIYTRYICIDEARTLVKYIAAATCLPHSTVQMTTVQIVLEA